MNFLSRYKDLGEEFDPSDILIKNALRVNTLKIDEKKLVARLTKKGVKLEKISFLKHGYFYESTFSLGSTPEYLQGFYYLQDPVSQIPVELLDLQKTDLVLDMAASPGGKTTQISQLQENEGIIFALDNHHLRLKSLCNNLERLSAGNVLVLKKDSRYANDLDIVFDKILLDAPCSGNFCVEKNFFKRTKEDIDSRVRLQKELLRTSFELLKKDGLLVYSTCSLEPEENELMISWFLEKFDVSLEETNLSVGDPGLTEVFGKSLNKDLCKTRRFWPHKTGTIGFFVAKIKKN